VARFLGRVRPRLAVVMETELWPNLFRRCGVRRTPLVLANARLSARSARGYRRVASLTSATLQDVTRIAAQSGGDAARLVALGVPAERVAVTGNIKFDITLPDRLPQLAMALRVSFGRRPVWIAGSTHEGEERMLLEAHAALRRRYPDLLLVLVPRHPERFAAVAALATRQGFRLARRSVLDDPAGAAVYLGDTMGELQLLYAAADIAFVGGSLVPTGGHNLLEPAALGRPVLCGPYLFNFTAIAELLIEAGAATQVATSGELAAAVITLLEDPARRQAIGDAGQRVVAANRGALDRLEAMLLEELGIDRRLPPACTEVK
jgi:3-deoxy-D-manno-octulosonic-acid transferase